MDTYRYVSSDCIKCGRCVKACQEQGEGFIIGGRGRGAIETSDYVPCHHCNGYCIKVCHYNAIKIERW